MVESKTIADMLKSNVDNKELTDKEFRDFCKTLVEDWELTRNCAICGKNIPIKKDICDDCQRKQK